MPSMTSVIVVWGLMVLGYARGAVYENTATYDDLTSVPAVGNPVGTYKGLTYEAFVVGGPPLGVSLPSVGGVAAQSGHNYAVSEIVRNVLNGTTSVVVASPYKSVSLLDFYFGCSTATANGVVKEAIECTITVAGFQKSKNQEIALASYTFTPPVSPVKPVPMIHAVLPSTFHQALYNITFANSNPLASTEIDNFHYDLVR
ncbi:hypothetical protein ACLMJK_006223 [Lecanora helva]